MKKISRKDLQGLRQQFPVLTKELMRRYVGGLTDNYCGADWFSDTYVMAFSSEGGSSYGYGGGGTYDGKPDWWTDGNYNLPKPYDNDETFNGGELDEVVIYGNRPNPKPYLNLPTEPEEPAEPDFPIFPPNPPTSPDDNQGNRPGSGGGLPEFGLPNWPYNGGYPSNYGSYGYLGTGTGGGGISSGGESGNITNTNNNLTTVSDVIDPKDFSGYKATEPKGCQARCIEMLANAGVEMNGTKISMVSKSNGRAGNALSTAQLGIDTINNALENGEPVIVGVDYKNADYNDGLEDHFIVIVGRTVTKDSNGNQIVKYHYYDPQTGQTAHGTSTNNMLTLTSDKKIAGTYVTTGGKSQSYTVTSVRPNK